MGKVRIYDLAKELKLESKRVLEDARRMGVDVSVPSNTLDENIAAKIREMYYPKKEQAALPRTARLIKHHPTAEPAGMAAQAVPAVMTETIETAPIQAKVSAEPVQQRITPLAVPVPQAAPGPKTAPAEAAPLPAAGERAKPRIVKLQATLPAAARPEIVTVEEESLEDAGLKLEPVAEPAIAPHEAPEGVTEPQKIAAEAPAVEMPAVKPEAPAAVKPVAPSAVSLKGESRSVGTKVIKLTPPPQPLPKPAAKPVAKPVAKPAPAPKTTGRGQEAALQKGQAKEGARDKEVHILPSGAQQRTVYIPPKDQRPKGRHQVRKEKEKEGQQKLLPKRPQMPGPVVTRQVVPQELKVVRLVEGSTVREFAEKIDAKPRDIVTTLMQRGVMATINQTINPEIAKEIGRTLGYDISFGEFEDMIVESEFEITPEVMEDNELRAPVITVMGHVDHGKTSLLDAIRSTRVAEGEAGGITQHIGAYSVEVPNPDGPTDLRRVVFLDTPGHEAFTLMRARGAKVTDIVVLVVAADDGVMPQTVEAIEHARAAKVPIIVAINKIDKPDANPDRVKKALGDRNLLWTGWGGDVEMVEVSAKKKQNIDGLLEMILLTADINELKANPKRRATGTVLEAKLDRGRGAVATVLIQNGTLHIGDPFIVGNYFGKVRALMSDRGERVLDVGPATPVEVLGLEGVPSAGDQIQVVDDISKAQQISAYRQAHARAAALARSAARGLDQLRTQMESGEVKELLVILKADVQGSVEVLKDTLLKLSTDKVKVRIIRSDVGAITESDVLLASASQATDTGAATVIIGFNVRPESRADEIAKQENVDIRLHSIIYKVEEEVRSAMLGLMEATMKEVIIGKAEVRDVIRVPKVGAVAGCMVTNGTIKRTAQARLIRDNVVIFETQIGSLRRFKDDVSEVQQGFECGITIERFNDFKIGDVIEAFITEKVAPTKLE